MLENFEPTVLRVFGGLVTFIDRVALGLGLSPACRNARFAPGMVATRDGYGVALTDEDQWFTGVTQLIRANGGRHLLVLVRNGILKVEFSPWAMVTLETGIRTDSSMKAASLFSTKYLCFSDGKIGTMPLHRYDGSVNVLGEPNPTTLVGAGAPGKAPVFAESAVASAGTGLLAGVHSCVIVFVNKAGDVSGWSPVASATFVGGKKTEVTIPLGPPDTAQRIIAITPANDARNFMYVPRFVLNENAFATVATIDVLEDELLTSQLSVTRWLTSYVPWNPAGCMAYQERLLLWGSRATLQPGVLYDPSASAVTLQNIGFRNLAFDGGFATNLPNGWTLGVAGGGPGGSSGDPFYGKCYKITGDNASLTLGTITQTVKNNDIYLRPQARYGVAAMTRSPSGSGGNLCVDISGAIGGVFIQARFPLGTDTDGNWVSTTFEMTAPLAVDEVALTATVYWSGAAPLGATKYVECKLAIYDADDAQHLHTVLVSDSGRPGTFVGETCSISVGPDDGEGIRSIFKLRDGLYIAKERSLHMLTSTSAGEPNTWGADFLDPYAGTPSHHGVAVGAGFALIAGRDGLRLFDGASTQLVSREIEPTWRSAAWNLGERVVVVLDPAKEIVRVALPTGATVSYGAGLLLTLDHKEGWNSPVPGGNGTKWSIDDFPNANPSVEVMAGALVQLADGSHAPVLSVRGGTVQNMVPSRDFSTPSWTFSKSVTVTTGQDDRREGGYATDWQWASGNMSAVLDDVDMTGFGAVTVVSFRTILNATSSSTSVTVSSTHHSDTTTVVLVPGVWARVAAYFVSPISPAPAGTFDITLAFVNGDANPVKVRLADMQVAYQSQRADFGFNENFGSGSGVATCSLLVRPTPGLYRDFSGRIAFSYETAMLGSEIGRSLFDRCVIRAGGSGYLAASYSGVGSRTWAMTPIQVSTGMDEEVEYGADMKAPAASVVLSTTSEDGWAVIHRVAVAIKGLSTGWLRGRNG